MTLVDSSIWVEHLRRGNSRLAALLVGESVLIHPFVIGELACGMLNRREVFLADLKTLPRSIAAGEDEVLQLLEGRRLWGKGIGWVDAHLLASALLSGCRLWTLDRRLAEIAAAAGVEIVPPAA